MILLDFYLDRCYLKLKENIKDYTQSAYYLLTGRINQRV